MIEYTEQEHRDAAEKVHAMAASTANMIYPKMGTYADVAIDIQMRLTKAEALLNRTQTVQIQSNPQPYHDLNKEIVAFLEGSKA